MLNKSLKVSVNNLLQSRRDALQHRLGTPMLGQSRMLALLIREKPCLIPFLPPCLVQSLKSFLA
jgi:hypothetical protein